MSKKNKSMPLAPLYDQWYCKTADPRTGKFCTVTFALSIHNQPTESFIQVAFSEKESIYQYFFDPDQCSFNSKNFSVQLGPNLLTSQGMQLRLGKEGPEIRADLRFGPLTGVQKPFSFFKQGWLFPFTSWPLSHEVVSLDHAVYGEVCQHPQKWQIQGARGYIEKNRPPLAKAAYLRLQSNSFKSVGTSLVIVVEQQKILGKKRGGFLCIFQHQAQQYRISSLDGGKMVHSLAQPSEIFLYFKKSSLAIIIRVTFPSLENTHFPGSIQAIKGSRLYLRVIKGERTLYETMDQSCSLEIQTTDFLNSLKQKE